ncbi:MAG: hypothetical protein ACFE7R_04870 [Candidatus Hodarchaeota archaeon]
MTFEKRFIPLLLLIAYGVAYAFVFLTEFTSHALSLPIASDWDMILFVPGLADVDNLYLIFGTIPWTFVALLWSALGAGMFIILNRLGMRSRTMSVDSVEPKLSVTRLITRAVVPGMFAFSIGETIIQYMNQLSLAFFQAPGVPAAGAEQTFGLFLARTLHLSLLFLPITLAVFIPSWILNDFGVISRLKDTRPGEFTDPIKVGQWVSGLLSGFSMIAFPLTFLNRFLIGPFEDFGWQVIENRLPTILWTMFNVLVIFVAFVLPVVIAYEAGKSTITKWFSRVAGRLGVEHSKLDTSYLGQDEPKEESAYFTPSQFEEIKESEKLSSPDYEEMEAGVKLEDDEENDEMVGRT